VIVEHVTAPNRELEAELRTFLQHQRFGPIAMDWQACIADADRQVVDGAYHLLRADDRRLLAVAASHRILALNCGLYLGSWPQAGFEFLDRHGIRPLALSIAFVEIPLGNSPAIWLAPELSSDHRRDCAEMLLKGIGDYYTANGPCGFLVAKVEGTSTTAGWATVADIRSKNWIDVPFLDNNWLDLSGSRDWESFVSGLSANGRSALRRNQKVFVAAGGTLEELSDDIDEHVPAIADLYRRTEQHHVALGELRNPILIDEPFLRRFGALPRANRRVLLARIGSEIIGFALVLIDGETLYFNQCGLDYQRAEPARAYFNLYYGLIQIALREGLSGIDMGPTTYEAKRRVGSVRVPTEYRVDCLKRWLRPLIRLVSASFSEAKARE
jgi:hypothetical protein